MLGIKKQTLILGIEIVFCVIVAASMLYRDPWPYSVETILVVFSAMASIVVGVTYYSMFMRTHKDAIKAQDMLPDSTKLKPYLGKKLGNVTKPSEFREIAMGMPNRRFDTQSLLLYAAYEAVREAYHNEQSYSINGVRDISARIDAAVVFTDGTARLLESRAEFPGGSLKLSKHDVDRAVMSLRDILNEHIPE